MDTSKLSTKVKNLVLTKKGNISQNITKMLANCRFDESQRKIYTGYYSGTGKYTSAHYACDTVISLLEAQGYKYTTGNDAPRGGANGQFVKMSKTAFNFVSQFNN